MLSAGGGHFHRGHLLSLRGVSFALEKGESVACYGVVQGQFAGTSMTYMRGERKV